MAIIMGCQNGCCVKRNRCLLRVKNVADESVRSWSQARGVLHRAGWRNPMSDLNELKSTGSSLLCAAPLSSLSLNRIVKVDLLQTRNTMIW